MHIFSSANYLHRQEYSTAFSPLKPYEIQKHTKRTNHGQNRPKATTSHDIDQEPPTIAKQKLPVMKFNRQLTIYQLLRT